MGPSQCGGMLAISVGERSTLLDGLGKLDYGFARDVAARLEATKCGSCRGTGFAPYVGGDDDMPCATCDGTGWRKAEGAGSGSSDDAKFDAFLGGYEAVYDQTVDLDEVRRSYEEWQHRFDHEWEGWR